MARFACVALAAWSWLICPVLAQEDPGDGDAVPAARAPEKSGSMAPQAPGLAPAEKDDIDAAYDYIRILTEAMIQIKKRYVTEKTYKEIIYGAMYGMLSGLDPHSSFMDSDEYAEIKDDTEGSFSGIGAHVGSKNGVLTIIAPIEDTPAFRAGLQSGDAVTEIDGVKTASLSLEDAIKRLRGPKGTQVTLTIQREGSDERKKVEIVRDEILVPSVKGARMLRDGIGYVRITQFTAQTVGSLQAALDGLMRTNLTALVLDLRSNPGGLLETAIEVSEKFLPESALIVSTQGRASDRIEAHAAGAVHLTGFPMAVLVNAGSASASEIVAGALQDHKRAFLVGDTSFGKGSVQSLIPIGSDRKIALRLTVAYYYTPSGRLIHEKGLEPDIPVYVSAEEWRKVQTRRAHVENPDLFTATDKKTYEDVEDRVLERAVDVLQAIRAFK
jgi:carboxyl-terminal processing protease